MCYPAAGLTLEQEEPEHPVDDVGKHRSDQDHPVVDAPAAQCDVDDEGRDPEVPEQHLSGPLQSSNEVWPGPGLGRPSSSSSGCIHWGPNSSNCAASRAWLTSLSASEFFPLGTCSSFADRKRLLSLIHISEPT